MAQPHSQRRSTYEEVEPVPDSTSPVVFAAPRALVRAPDGTTRWVARCPRCTDRDDESIVAGNQGCARAKCQTCGAIVEIRESGIYPATPTTPPPKE